MTQKLWKEIGNGIFCWEESCSIYAVRGETGYTLISAGSGKTAGEMIQALSDPVKGLFLTHYFRDVSGGAGTLIDHTKAELRVPWYERFYYIDAEQHWRERQTMMLFDTRSDRFAPRESINAKEFLYDWDEFEFDGLSWKVLPAPGQTPGAVVLVLNKDNRKIAFSGDLISAPGKVHRMAPLQYNYNEQHGFLNSYGSSRILQKENVDLILPAHGKPMEKPEEALKKLQDNLSHYAFFLRGQPEVDQMKLGDQPQIEEVFPGIYRSLHASAETHFLVGESSKVLSLDYGWSGTFYSPGVRDNGSMRPMLHALDDLEKETGRKGIDAVLVTHYHDDHIANIPTLVRLFGSEVLAAPCVAEVLRDPQAYRMQCLWPESIQATERETGVWHEWDGIRYRLEEVSGHTRHATIVFIEYQGKKVCHIGDQFFWFHAKEGGFNYGENAHFFSNHVYQNGLDQGCYKKAVNLLKDFQPEWILSGHSKPYKTDKQWYEKIQKGAAKWDEMHEMLLSLTEDDMHFSFGSDAVELQPYRVHLKESEKVVLRARVRNPFPEKGVGSLELRGPAGWEGEEVSFSAGPHEIVDLEVAIMPPSGVMCRRVPLGAFLKVNGKVFGELGEALVTIGGEFF